MSATITTDIFCDVCGDWIHGASLRKEAVAFARRKAKESGWVYRLVDGEYKDICPECVAKENG